MALPFVFPSNLKDLEEEAEEGECLRAVSPVQISTLRPSQIEDLVKGMTFDLSDRDLFCVEEQDIFDKIYSLVRDFTKLAPALKFNLVETLRSNLCVLLPSVDSLSRAAESSPGSNEDGICVADRVASYRNALKIYSFFLLSIALAEQSIVKSVAASAIKVKKKNTDYAWNWETQRSRIINLIANSLEINLSLLFGPGSIDDNYISFISKCTFTLYENQNLLRDEETRKGLGRIIGTISTKLSQTDQICASVLHLIHKYDYTVAHIAEAVAFAEQKYGDGTLAVALIREFGRTDPRDYARDTTGAENIGRFLVDLASHSPKLVATNIGVLIPHLGGESYKIRNSLVSVLGKLIAKAFKDNGEVDISNKSLRLRGKQAMLEILLERCRDVSAYTRSRVLQVWAELCEESSIIIGLWNEVASIASGRLEDKSAIVRKSALCLLISMLQHNPFGPQLRILAFEATLQKYKEKLQLLAPNVNQEENREENQEEAILDEEEQEGGEVEDNSVSDSCRDLTGTQQEDTSVPDMGGLEQIRALVASLEAGLRFSRQINSVMPILVQLMASPNATDVEYTILLLMRCRQFQIDGSDDSLRKMLPLVFSQDKSIYEAVENAFITIYLRKNATETAKNLINLAINSSIGDLAALESLVSSLVFRGEISSSTISALWDFFSFNIPGSGVVQSRGALSILNMAAKSSPSVFTSHLSQIIDIGFGRWSKQDPLLARTACVALEKLSKEDKQKLIDNNNRVFGSLQNLITGFFLPGKIWYTAADKAINTVYAVHPVPEVFASESIRKSFEGLGFMSGTESDDLEVLKGVPVVKLGRFLFVISHVALNHLVYIESCVRKVQKQKGKKEKDEANSNNTEVAGINAELGIGATVDATIDSLADKAEKEIVSSSQLDKYLIGKVAPFLSKLCRNLNLLQKYPDLQSSAMLALCKLMIIDADFCEENLQLLFTVASGADNENVRSNCTLALGDLAVRFPNLLEPWTQFIYARLSDASISVRKNAVLVISHLILNDMMKVKGYINEMAARIEDEDERISSLAKLFFHELSKKGSNPIYNLLPDILGQLCNQKLQEDSFCNIMQFLISSIKKDKQMDSLVEKLCNRFTGVNDVKQWEYIAYCMSQLTLTEKGLKKLIDSFKSYEHVLSQDSVLNHFKTLIAKCKKFAKAEAKACIEEFEEKIGKIHEERKEQEITARNAKLHQQRVGTLQGFLSKKKATKKNVSHEDENGEVLDPSIEENNDIENEENSDDNSSEESSVTKTKSFELANEEEEETEAESPISSRRDMSKAKTKKSKGSALKDSEVSISVSRRKTRTKRS